MHVEANGSSAQFLIISFVVVVNRRQLKCLNDSLFEDDCCKKLNLAGNILE